jgi:hypothetical protein
MVYKETPTFEGGELVKVLDRDPNDGSLAVATLEDVYRRDGDIIKLLQNSAKWVKPEHIQKLTFERERKYNHYIMFLLKLNFGYTILKIIEHYV